MVPLALTPTERRLASVATVPATVAGAIAATYVCAWCVGANPDELFVVLFVGVIGFAPVWFVVAAALRLQAKLRRTWVDTRALPRPTLVLLVGAPLILLTTAWDLLGPLDAWRWAALLPVASAILAALAYGSTLWRRWRRRDGSRWSPTPR